MGLFIKKMRSFFRSEDGSTATEYAVMLALIIVVCIAARLRLCIQTLKVACLAAPSWAIDR